MNLNQRAIKRAIGAAGGQRQVAKKLGVSQSAVSQWLHGRSRIDPRHFGAVERATEGEFTEGMLMDDWLKSRLPRRMASSLTSAVT
jgi:DNA-binding transcriptional regulator YdaS (Cro superfamily)